MANLEGKTVLVTASGQGIGRASVLGLIAAGASVYATDINEALLAQLPPSDRLTTGRLDVRDDAAVADFISGISPVDVLFNCAGVVHPGTILDMKDGDLDFAFDLNVKSMVRTIRAVLPGMISPAPPTRPARRSPSMAAGRSDVRTPSDLLTSVHSFGKHRHGQSHRHAGHQPALSDLSRARWLGRDAPPPTIRRPMSF